MSVITPLNNAVPFASSGLKNDIPQSTTVPGRASMQHGFPQETMRPPATGGKPPYGQDVNGILHQLSSHQVFLNAGGLYRFNATYAAEIGGYAAGAVVQLDDGLSAVICTRDANQHNPNDGLVDWAPYAGKILEQRLSALENVPAHQDIRIGDILITMNDFASGAAVALHKGYGSWQRVAEGQFIIGAGHHVDSRDESRDFEIGEQGGTYRHVLLENELSEHVHRVAASPAVYEGVHSDIKNGYVVSSIINNQMLGIVAKSDSTGADLNDNYTIKPDNWAATGNNQPHNNMPPYIAMAIWKRIA